MKTRLFGLLFGVAFGFWLCWARFARYDVIQAGLRFQSLYLWLMFATAVVTAGIGLRVLRAAGARTLLDGRAVVWTTIGIRREHLVGSALFGVGWAIAGTCPGPAAAQIGHGQLAGLFSAGGIFAGVWLQGWLAVRRASAAVGAARSATTTAPPGPCAEA
jgi:uncharacterized membrane protein YedE/YeeE